MHGGRGNFLREENPICHGVYQKERTAEFGLNVKLEFQFIFSIFFSMFVR